MFGKKQAPQAPLRRGAVMAAIKTHMDFEAAIDRDLEGPAFEQVQKAHNDSLSGLTKAEIARVYEAQDRHGY